MSTTTLFVDLLIIGIQVAIWLALLFLSLFGVEWIDLAQIKGWEAAIGVLLLPLIYPVGVFVDHGADALLSGWRKQIRNQYLQDKSRTVMDLLMAAKDDRLNAYYDYLRIRIRISRSSAVNFGAIAILFPIFVMVRLNGLTVGPSWFLATTVALASAVVAGLALCTWVSLTHGFYEKLVHGLEVVAQLKSDPSVPPPVRSVNVADGNPT